MEDLLKMKVSDLKKKCKELGLSVIGTKAELVTRLQEHKNETGDESVLNEAELLGDLDSSDAQAVSNVDEDLLLGDSISESKDDKLNEEHENTLENGKSEDDSEPLAKIAKVDSDLSKTDEKASKAVVSEEQKKQERAARFGITTNNEDEKKIARAQRFGIEPSTNGELATDIEKLKKREERFGVSVSDKLKKAMDDEKKQKRAERFGIDQSPIEKPNNDITENEDKKSLRAARFGLGAEDEKKKARAARFGK